MAASLTIAPPSGAQDTNPQTLGFDKSQLTLQNHHSSQACGKRWLKRARRLAEGQLEWMLRSDHKLYSMLLPDGQEMTLEILSTASFRDCDVEQHWNKRETTARITRYRSDGEVRVRLFHFAQDDIFFNQRPRILAQAGKILLTGVTLDGRPASRWIFLPELARHQQQPPIGTGVLIAAN